MTRTQAVCYTSFGLYYFAVKAQEILWGLERQSTQLCSLVEKCHFTSAESNTGCLGSHLLQKKLLFLQYADWNWSPCVPEVLPYICRLQLHCKMHSNPQLLFLRISFFSRAINYACWNVSVASPGSFSKWKISCTIPSGITGMVSHYTFPVDFILFCICRYKISLLCTACALVTAVLPGISSRNLEAGENRHMRSILANTDVGSVASSSGMRIKSCLILFLHIAVCRDNGSLFVTYVSPTEMSYTGGGAQAGQDRSIVRVAVLVPAIWDASTWSQCKSASLPFHQHWYLTATRCKEAPPQTSGI